MHNKRDPFAARNNNVKFVQYMAGKIDQTPFFLEQIILRYQLWWSSFNNYQAIHPTAGRTPKVIIY